MFFLCFVVLALLPYQGFGQQCGTCPNGFKHNKEANKCYKVFGEKKTWDEANKACTALNSHLVILRGDSDIFKTAFEQVKDSCKNNLIKLPGFWSAGKRKCPNGSFFLSPNTGIKIDLSKANWNPGEPKNSGGNENCVHILHYNNALVYNDVPCESPNCFICQIDL